MTNAKDREISPAQQYLKEQVAKDMEPFYKMRKTETKKYDTLVFIGRFQL